MACETVKNGDEAAVEWIWVVCMAAWKYGCFWLLYKGNDSFYCMYKCKGSKDYCKDYGGRSLLGTLSKIYGRIVIDLIKRISEPLLSKNKVNLGIEEGI